MSNKRKGILWPMLLVMGATLALTLASARTRRAVSTVAGPSSIEARRIDPFFKAAAGFEVVTPRMVEPADVARAQNDEQVEVEVLTVGVNGFEPSAITRPEGPFLLAIHNQSGVSELSLRLDRVNGNRVHEVQLARGRNRWVKRFNLPAGDYVLSEQNHPAWLCRIRLTAQ